MNWQSLVDPSFSGRLCLTLLHSVWQVGLLAVAARCAQSLLRKRSVELAYAVHAGALVLALAAMPVTWTLVEVPDPIANATVDHSSPNQVAETSPAVATRVVIPAAAAQQNQGSIEAHSAVAMPIEPDAALPVPELNSAAETSSAWLQVAPWIVALYAAGVLVMLARVMAGIWQAQRLVASAQVIAQGPLLDALRSLARKWSMWIMPELAWAESIIVPKVVGLVRPTILLPASAITGLAPDQLEMILAHELAHVRRSDLWVNLVQRLAEAVLFFNPALWYLSRRISTLREYCCDELACQAQSGSEIEPRTRYAMALLRVVELARAGNASGRGRRVLDQADVAALAAHGRSPSELRRRVARLFGEPLREPLRLSRGSVLMLAGLAIFLVLGPAFWPTTTFSQQPKDLASSRSEDSDQNREPNKTKASDNPNDKTATISGKIVLEDGSPAMAKGWLYSKSTRSTTIAQSTDGQFSDSFEIEVQPGTVILSHFSDSFAPAWTGPLELDAGERMDDVKIVLKPGFSAPLRVVNERGEPVAGATVVVHPEIHGSTGGPVIEKATNEEGEYLLEHLADTKYSVRVEAPGYEPLRTDPLVMRADTPIVLTMNDSKPTAGIVRNADGTPAAGAKLYLKNEMPKGGTSFGQGHVWGKLVATADEQGRFKLDELTSGSHYLFVVETADQARLVVHDITAGLEEVQITVPQRRDLIAKLKGDLSKLPQRHGKPFIAVRQRIEFRPAPGKQYGELLGDDAQVELTDAGGEAVIRGLAVDQEAESGKQQVEVSPGYDEKFRKIVDLNPDGETRVAFEFPAAEEKKTAAEPNENALLTARVVDAETGKPIPEFQALAGTSPMEGLGWQWQPHTIHQFKERQLQWPPAGQRGYDMQVVRLEAQGYIPYQTPPVKNLAGNEPRLIAGYTKGADGKPIPRIISARPGKPESLEIRMHRDPGIAARVLDPRGQPAADAMVAVGMSHREVRLRAGKILVDDAPAESLRDRWSQPRHTRTDKEGRFTLQSEVVPAVVVVTHPSGVAVVNFRDVSDSSELKLQPWGRIEGQVLWNQTPGAGEKMSLIAHGDTGIKDVDAGLLVSVSEEATTDAAGRFVFDLVPPGRAQIARYSNPPGEWNMQSLNPVQHVDVLAGAPTKFVFGGRGRPVIGKLMGRSDWSNVWINIAPNAPRPGFLADPKDPTWPAYRAFLASAAGKHYVKNDITVMPDGTFRIEGVPPEHYQLFVRGVDEDENVTNLGYQQFTIGTIPGGESDEALDLGTLPVTPPPATEDDQKTESDKSKESAEAKRKGPILRGRVVDENNKPISDVKVVLYGGLATRFRGQETTTNADGEYRFDPLGTGAMMMPDDKPHEYYTGMQINHESYVPADGKSWRDVQVPMVDRHEKVLDLAMTRGGKVGGTIVLAGTDKPAANLDLRIHNGLIKGDDGTFFVYATTDAAGKFQSAALFPGRYVIEINDNDFEGKYRYPKIGAVDIIQGKTAEVKLTTRERLELQDPFQITGTAKGSDGKSMVYGGVGVRIVGGESKLRTRGGGIDGRDLFGLGFGPADRIEPSAKAPYGVGTHDIEIIGNNTRFGYKLAKRTPSEPLRITDNPEQPELENGVRYIHPNRPLNLELEFVKE